MTFPIALLVTMAALDAPATADAAPESGGAPAVPATRMLGELALSRGMLGFAACDAAAGTAYGAAFAGDLAAVVSGFNDGADGVVFVDADIAREADGRWRVDRLHRAYRDGPRCAEDLRDFVWRAVASDGSWTLEVSRRYVSLRPAGQRPQFFRYRPFTRDDDGHLRFSGTAEGQTLDLVLRGLRCTDAAARRMTPWQIEVSLGGNPSPGCAWTGMPPR